MLNLALQSASANEMSTGKPFSSKDFSSVFSIFSVSIRSTSKHLRYNSQGVKELMYKCNKCLIGNNGK